MCVPWKSVACTYSCYKLIHLQIYTTRCFLERASFYFSAKSAAAAFANCGLTMMCHVWCLTCVSCSDKYALTVFSWSLVHWSFVRAGTVFSVGLHVDAANARHGRDNGIPHQPLGTSFYPRLQPSARAHGTITQVYTAGDIKLPATTVRYPVNWLSCLMTESSVVLLLCCGAQRVWWLLMAISFAMFWSSTSQVKSELHLLWSCRLLVLAE